MFGKRQPGSGSACAKTGCIFDAKYCVRINQQCAIKEDKVDEKCGAWDECAGVVCKASYGGYCFAGAVVSTRADPTMWGYRKGKCLCSTD